MSYIIIDALAINAELARLRAMDKEREKVHNQKFKGNRDLCPASLALTQTCCQDS